MNRKLTLALTVIAVALFALGLLAEPALAKATPAEAGDHLGDVIRNTVKPILFVTGGVIALGAVFKQNYLLALSVLGLTVISLGFLIKPSPYEGWGKETVETVFAVVGPIWVR